MIEKIISYLPSRQFKTLQERNYNFIEDKSWAIGSMNSVNIKKKEDP